MYKFMLLISIVIFSTVSLTIAAEKVKQKVPAIKIDRTNEKVVLNQSKYTPVKLKKTNPPAFEGGIIFWEDFEPGGESYEWTATDLTLPRPEHGPSKWIVDSYNALGGASWRCADLTYGNHGGYGNHWYQVLDTPPITVDNTSVNFSFYHRYSIEDPGAESPYDGWDGCNVRISTDNGATWDVLSNGSYNVSSSWAFGHPVQGQNEGTGVPSWAGEQTNWKKELFDLSSYISADEPFILRFAFASDQAFSTEFDAEGNYDPDLFGWIVDSIRVASNDQVYFTNNGENVDMTGQDIEYIIPAGGNLWHTAEVTEPFDIGVGFDAPSGPYAASCQNGSAYSIDSTYNPFMDNNYATGPISLPDVEPIYLDFKYLPYFADGDAFPDVEFFRPEVRPVDSTEWEWIEDEPYVYSEGADVWLEFAGSYGFPVNRSMFDLSRYAGQNIYLSFRFWSDEDQPIGPGLLIDDVVIYSPTKTIVAPSNVSAESVPADTSVNITWDYAEGMHYIVWRALPGESNFFYRGELDDSSRFIDKGTDVKPIVEYRYALTANVKYEGESSLSDPAAIEIIPDVVIDYGHTDGIPDGYIESAAAENIAVKITPPVYPSYISHIKVNVNTTGTTGSSARVNFFNTDPSGIPGDQITYQLYTGLREGFNTILLTQPLKIEFGSVFVSYERFSSSPYLSKDTTQIVSKTTYYKSGDVWSEVTDYNAMINAYIDTSGNEPVGIRTEPEVIADTYQLGKNYPNPFNPETTIPVMVPIKGTKNPVRLEIYNILGQKIAELYNGSLNPGLHHFKWNGLNNAGQHVGSGIYIYQLTGESIRLSKRMLLIK